ncbi:MAG TPA: DNA-binding protein [Verrucomicrobiae bacterium]|nr:DNA-binding protein [Verrucomicrobiae bacterium]
MRVFLDANILFSAAKPNSRVRALIALLTEHGECVTNAYAVEEARRNIAVKEPALVAELDRLTARLEIITALITDLEIDLQPKDVPILGGAVAGGASHLLTGDERDFGAWFGKTVQGVRIVSPRLLADELVRNGLL